MGAKHGDPVIKTEGLCKRFSQIRAVDNLHLEVREGEIFGLVGPDGAGKTTTLRMLVAILWPDEGKISVLGREVPAEAETIKPHIGYMPQRFSLYGDLTVEENLDFYAEIHEVPGRLREKRKQELLSWAGLKPHSYKLADQLSGGMKQKLALACNLIHEPAVLFLDEPSTGVDPVARRDFWRILFRLREQGSTILVSTPYMDEAERCDRIAFIHNGRILACATPQAIKNLFQGHLLLLLTETIDMLHVAKERLRQEPWLDDVLIYGNSLHLTAQDKEQAGKLVPAILRREGVRVVELKPIAPSLEDAFTFLVKQGGRVGGKRDA
ncbi:ABC transporter ATP-binding protein [Thermanaeromonas sp. C210]|uniref:ABC transporter ATP-binding protein n=1 Tax=Thermanaeromonas sp. C210 TaxID=2731925 RepID=UPI00155CD2F1|nr:ABC transporter ATP-binding protein [Thermanaeromonas sp. C210]GFN21832.1 multidrug ABC transporter ATP-binding protein [Thermanaeromonas sp. C210]